MTTAIGASLASLAARTSKLSAPAQCPRKATSRDEGTGEQRHAEDAEGDLAAGGGQRRYFDAERPEWNGGPTARQSSWNESVRRMRRRVILRSSVVGAGHGGIELREDAIRVRAMEPDVTIEMRLEHVRFVNRGGGIVHHRVPRYSVEGRRLGMACGAPGSLEHQVLHGDQRQIAVFLWFVDQNARLAKIGVRADAGDAWRSRRDAEQVGTEVVNAHGS